jgi:hypothetical protein
MSCKIILSERIFKVGNQRMLLDHLAIILVHSFRIELCLLPLLFILVWVFWIFIVTAISVAVDTNLEYFPAVIISS